MPLVHCRFKLLWCYGTRFAAASFSSSDRLLITVVDFISDVHVGQDFRSNNISNQCKTQQFW